MSANSSIEWTDRTWNPVRGCSVISPGCVNCYAMKFAHRFSGAGKPYEGLTKQTKAGPQWTGVVSEIIPAISEPLRWKKPARIFVNSMSDLFHEAVSDAFISAVWGVMSLSPRHTYQILTKRPDRMRALLPKLAESHRPPRWPLPNVWLGVSVENQKFADERIPHLLKTPAAVRFISAEPLLGPINLGAWTTPIVAPGVCVDIDGEEWHRPGSCPSCQPALDWVIVGGESGPGAREFNVDWARTIVKQCKAAGVAVFVKQLGAKPMDTGNNSGYAPGVMLDEYNVRYELKDRKGGDITEFPTSLRVREFPAVRA